MLCHQNLSENFLYTEEAKLLPETLQTYLFGNSMLKKCITFSQHQIGTIYMFAMFYCKYFGIFTSHKCHDVRNIWPEVILLSHCVMVANHDTQDITDWHSYSSKLYHTPLKLVGDVLENLKRDFFLPKYLTLTMPWYHGMSRSIMIWYLFFRKVKCEILTHNKSTQTRL